MAENKPRNVRNFWVQSEIDGRCTTLVGGPAAKDGGFHLNIRQRDEGNITHPLTIDGRVVDDELLLTVWDVRNGLQQRVVFTHSTQR